MRRYGKTGGPVIELQNSAGSITTALKLTDAGELELGSTSQSTGGIQFLIDGAGSAVTTGIKGDIELPFAGEIESVRLFADQTGSIVIDIWKDTYANFAPTVADTITAAAKPTLSSAIKFEDTTLTGWTKTFSKGDILRINVDSAATLTRVTLSLLMKRT